MMIGWVQPGTRRGTFLQMIGSRKMTPPRMLRIVPFGRLPHFLEVEFLDARFVGRDRRAFDADAVLLDGVGRVDRHLVVGRVAVLDAEIVIFEIDVEIGMDQLVLDQLPDDAGHLVAVEFDDGAFNLDFLHGMSREEEWKLEIKTIAAGRGSRSEPSPQSCGRSRTGSSSKRKEAWMLGTIPPNCTPDNGKHLRRAEASLNVETETMKNEAAPEIRIGGGVPVIGPGDTPVAEVVHACHSASIDQGLAALAIPGLDRETLEPLLQYCAGLRCVADNVSCPGCKRRTEALGIETLDQFILSKKEVIVGDGRVRLKGEGTETVTTPCLETLSKQWSGENYWFWARRVIRKLRHGLRRAHMRGEPVAGEGETPSVILMEPQLADNIGMVARACANFGLDDLRLVSPRDGWPNEKARIAASGANYIIDDARAFSCAGREHCRSELGRGHDGAPAGSSQTRADAGAGHRRNAEADRPGRAVRGAVRARA